MTAPTSNETRIYQLQITLVESDPPIRRTVQVPANTDLETLHDILQVAMGWENAHLYEFSAGSTRYGLADDDALDWTPDLKPARDTRKDELLVHDGGRISYVYDLGDCWEHDVFLEKVIDPEPGAVYPRCVAAERACPPEDCGGVWGYEELLRAVSDPGHEDHDAMSEWLGTGFDPEAVDVEEINRALMRVE